ncbi:MAG: phage portal protein [Lachnospiraceae bacterium]|nr:phage portal protein [Lachnospiraceae bacterium]
MPRVLTGRTIIYSDETEVTKENVCAIIGKAMGTHSGNRSAIDYLYNYYKGNQPILLKTTDIRPEINNIVLENRANEIVNFKVGYLLGEPIQYVARNKSDVSEAINTLNDFVFAEDKASKDKEIAEWFTVCGTAYRLVLPDIQGEIDESPFEIFTLDPRNTFVVYTNDIEKKPLLGVTYVDRENGTRLYTCYSQTSTFYVEERVDKGKATRTAEEEINNLGGIPIIEYPANSIRVGAFEVVITLLDAINQMASDRADAIDGFVQALMVFKGVDIDDDTFRAIKELGGLKVPADGDVKYLVQELNQQSTQTLVDNMYQTVLTIVGMPSTGDGNTSDSSNNGAVILKNGWYGAESRAKDTELMFKRSEKMFLKIALRIASTFKHLDLKLSDIDIRFTRRNYENLLVKSQVLTTMLANDKIHPRLAFEQSGMFIDTELAYTMSEEYQKQNEEKEAEELNNLRFKMGAEDIESKSKDNPNNNEVVDDENN